MVKKMEEVKQVVENIEDKVEAIMNDAEETADRQKCHLRF